MHHQKGKKIVQFLMVTCYGATSVWSLSGFTKLAFMHSWLDYLERRSKLCGAIRDDRGRHWGNALQSEPRQI